MAETNSNSRLEAFCDGVFAISITLLVIDIKIPQAEAANIFTTNDFWHALMHITPSIFAFVLSFSIILITWVNHHNAMKMGNKSSSAFMYANGFLLLTVAFLPFPTSLMGEYILSDHAAPAVILYESVLALQSLAWIFICTTAIRDNLTISEKALLKVHENRKYAVYAFAVYILCAFIANWFPVTIAIITTLIWVFWLIWGVKLKHEEMI